MHRTEGVACCLSVSGVILNASGNFHSQFLTIYDRYCKIAIFFDVDIIEWLSEF